MRKYLALIIALSFSFEAQSTSILERNLAECTISSNSTFEEIILKYVETQDADDYIYQDYVLDHTFGELEGESSDILGRHEQIRQRFFTSANAEGDGVIRDGRGDYLMIAQFEQSEFVVALEYVGQDQDDFPTYNMSFDGYGPVFDLVMERVDEALYESEHYDVGDDLLCVSHFNLDEFVTQ